MIITVECIYLMYYLFWIAYYNFIDFGFKNRLNGKYYYNSQNITKRLQPCQLKPPFLLFVETRKTRYN